MIEPKPEPIIRVNVGRLLEKIDKLQARIFQLEQLANQLTGELAAERGEKELLKEKMKEVTSEKKFWKEYKAWDRIRKKLDKESL